METGHHLPQQVVHLAVSHRIVVADLRGDHMGCLPLRGQHLLDALLDPARDLGKLPPLPLGQQLGERVLQHRAQLAPQVIDLRRVADQTQRSRERTAFRRRVQDPLAAGQVLAEHLTSRPHVVPQLSDDVALNDLDGLRHAGEVRGKLPRQVQHVLGRLKQLLVLDGLDGAFLFEPNELLLTLPDLLLEARDPGHDVRIGILRKPLDRLQQCPDPGLRHPRPHPPDPSGYLERTNAVCGQPIHLDVIIGHLPHQPSRLHPLPAQLPRVPSGQRLVVLIAIARGP